MRSALISRMVILSISSPIDTGVRIASTPFSLQVSQGRHDSAGGLKVS
jgi:hypothetical protein